MNFETENVERRGRSRRMAFPDGTNPNRAAAERRRASRETRGANRPFPESCEPRHANGPLTDEQRDLVTRYMPMAQRIAREAVVKAIRADELESEAYAALVFAARTFVPDRGIDFAVHARRRIAGVLRDYRRFLFQAKRRGRLNGAPGLETLETGEDLGGNILAMSEERPVGRALELAEAVEMVIRRLPGSEAVACRSLYVEGKSFEETAASMGCSKGHVSRLHGEALERIRRVHLEALAG